MVGNRPSSPHFFGAKTMSEKPRSTINRAVAGAELARRREEIGLTQTEMATELGLTKEYLCKLERNAMPISDRFWSHFEAIDEKYATLTTIFMMAGGDEQYVREELERAKGRLDDVLMALLAKGALEYKRTGEQSFCDAPPDDGPILAKENEELQAENKRLRRENLRLRLGSKK